MASITLAKKLIDKGFDIDEVLESFSISQLEYRKVYPETPMTSCFSIDIINAIDEKGRSRSYLKRNWNLSASQIKRAFDFKPNKNKKRDKLTRDKEIIKDLKKNLTLEQVMLKYDISKSSVYKIARKNAWGKKDRKKYKRLNDFEISSLKKDVALIGHHSAAKKYNISLASVYRLCQSNRTST